MKLSQSLFDELKTISQEKAKRQLERGGSSSMALLSTDRKKSREQRSTVGSNIGSNASSVHSNVSGARNLFHDYGSHTGSHTKNNTVKTDQKFDVGKKVEQRSRRERSDSQEIGNNASLFSQGPKSRTRKDMIFTPLASSHQNTPREGDMEAGIQAKTEGSEKNSFVCSNSFDGR